MEQQKKKGETQLFSNLIYYPSHGYWKDFGEDFNQKLKPQMVDKEILGREDLKIDFHSFRHCLSHNLKGKIEDNTLTALMGHSLKKSMSAGRYGSDYPVDVLKEAIEKLDYGIDFTKIKKEVDMFSSFK